MEENKLEGVGVGIPVAVSGVVESVSPSLSSPENKVQALRRVAVYRLRLTQFTLPGPDGAEVNVVAGIGRGSVNCFLIPIGGPLVFSSL